MRILVTSAYFETHRGGIEMVAGALVRQFRRAGHMVAWIAGNTDQVPEGFPVRCLPLRIWNGTEHIFGVPFPIPGLSALRAISREVTKADVIMIHDALYPTNIAAFLFARWFGKPVMVTQHIGLVPYSNPLLRLLMRAMNRVVARLMLSAADQVVYISRLTADTFRDVACSKPPQIVFNGVDPDVFHPAHAAEERIAVRHTFGLSVDRPIALFVGRFVEKKGLHILQHAARMGADVDWVFAGWGRIDPNAWHLPNVRVLSGLNQAMLAPLYRASDVFVLPSVGEGFPLVLQEAMVCGVPAVCGAETARADERLAAHLYPVRIESRAPEDVAKDVLASVRRAVAENDPVKAAARSALIGGWYSWPAAAGRYLDIFADMLKAKAAAKAAPKALSAAGADR